MSDFITIIIVASITGAGLITGLLFAFSNFVMRALADLPADKGMFVMQRINQKIINPLFMLLFLGTPLLCLLIIIHFAQTTELSDNLFLLIGAFGYIVGPFGITLLFNVPLNNQLAREDLSDSDIKWPPYQKKWQYWNHIRTYIGLLSVILLTLGLNESP